MYTFIRHPSVSLLAVPVRLSIYLSTNLSFMHPPFSSHSLTYPSLDHFIYPFISLSFNHLLLPTYLILYLPVHPSILYTCTYPPIPPSHHPSIHPSIHVLICPPIHSPTCPSPTYQIIHLPTHPSSTHPLILLRIYDPSFQ